MPMEGLSNYPLHWDIIRLKEGTARQKSGFLRPGWRAQIFWASTSEGLENIQSLVYTWCADVVH